MTEREEKRLAELLAKKEAEEKADNEFFKQVRKRKLEVLKELNIDAKVYEVVKGLSYNELLEKVLDLRLNGSDFSGYESD